MSKFLPKNPIKVIAGEQPGSVLVFYDRVTTSGNKILDIFPSEPKRNIFGQRRYLNLNRRHHILLVREERERVLSGLGGDNYVIILQAWEENCDARTYFRPSAFPAIRPSYFEEEFRMKLRSTQALMDRVIKAPYKDSAVEDIISIGENIAELMTMLPDLKRGTTEKIKVGWLA